MGDLNEADLAIIAYYYKAVEGDDNWAEAQKADVNKDGEVNIKDLAIVAQKILNKSSM